MAIGKTIEEKRTKLNLSQNDLAQKLGISYQVVSEWENNISEPDINNLKKLSEIFGCSVDDLVSKSSDADVKTVKHPIGRCAVCGKTIYEGDVTNYMNVIDQNGTISKSVACADCYTKHMAEAKKETVTNDDEDDEDDSKMKKVARVFIIIGLVCSIALIVFGFIFLSRGNGVYYLAYGGYGLVTSAICLAAINSSSKAFVVVAGIFYIPVMLLASIFMFCIDEDDLY